tara:strand:- start:306 stop:461 length:156 start_codon:yes stop_codon:yes gene_type:complete
MKSKKRVFRWDQKRAWWFDTVTGEPISEKAKVEPLAQINPTPTGDKKKVMG